MELKVLALGALVGVSLTTSASLPAMARDREFSITPIFCDLCDDFDQSGAFSRIVATPRGQQLVTFGMADTICPGTFVGARVDAHEFPATSWEITVDAPTTEPLFITELKRPNGEVIFTHATSSSKKGPDGIIETTFDAAKLGFFGDKFVSIFVYDSGEQTGISFQDFIDVKHGIRVDGSFPPVPVYELQNDCTGILGNGNA